MQFDPIRKLSGEIYKRQTSFIYKTNWQRLHIDPVLLGLLGLLIGIGLLILYSATNQNSTMMNRQLIRLGFAFFALFCAAQVPLHRYKAWTPIIFSAGLFLLVIVLIMGKIGKGAQRWLDLGFLRFQPSELMKLAVPMMVAWYFDQERLPPRVKALGIAGVFIALPTLLVAKQPDLGTALMILFAAGGVLLFAGLSGRLIAALAGLATASLPVIWHFMHNYQRQRVLTFLDPERDPLGRGYHIIQSKIAIGSGGWFGKGWLLGPQSHLHFLPEHATDFIFAVCAEEFGFLGAFLLLMLYLAILARCLWIACRAQDTFSRLLAGALAFSFFLSMFVNVGMVTGILPVVGLPLPLVSYGGTSMVTLLIGFGILMGIETRKNLLAG